MQTRRALQSRRRFLMSATAAAMVATAARSAGNNTVAGHALLRYLKLYPNAPQAKLIRKQAQSLLKSTPTVSSGSGSH